jgi:hypothetical protein
MTQNLMATLLDDAQWLTVDTAIDTLEEALAPMLVSLSTLQRRRLVEMGESSEPSCGRTHTVMRDNAELMPRALDMDAT